MDFLRRLAPPRETDATRAVAVLPSRFASESPLRATIPQPGPAQRLDEDETTLSFDTTSPPAVTNALAAQRHSVTGVEPSHAAPRPLGIRSTRRDSAQATSSTDAPADEPDTNVDDSRALQDRHGASSERAKATSPELKGLAAVADSSGVQGVAVPPLRPRVALPLSQAVLAQRVLQSRDESQVVHVTIGRIDVVANTATAPAVRHSPPPRQPTVALADYLRGGNGSHR